LSAVSIAVVVHTIINYL